MRQVFKECLYMGVLSVSLLSLCFESSLGQSQVAQLDRSVDGIGVPAIPSSLARQVDPYRQIYGLPVAGWDPVKRHLRLKGLSTVAWISLIQSPGAKPATSSIYVPSSGIYDLYMQPQEKYLAYTADWEGNEVFQLYLYEIERGTTTVLSDGKSRNTEPVWSSGGKSIIYSSSPFGASGVNLRLINPFDPKTDRLLVQSSGSYLKAYDWSPDDKRVVYCDFTSNTSSTLWLVDIASGSKVLLSPKTRLKEFYDYPQFSHDGKGVYVVTDHDSDFRRLAYIDLASHKISYIQSPVGWDLDEFQLAPDGKRIAFVTNEAGSSRLHVWDIVANGERSMQQLPVGVISDLKWHNNSIDFAFNFKSPRSPNDVYSVNAQTGKAELWAKSETNGVDTSNFSQAQLVHWVSFDNRKLSGFLYPPPAKFKGKHPVIIDLHGGPEEQYRPSFIYEDNYLLNELGIAKIYPNVRGSSGYGKKFLSLDDGLRREDAVKDIGALLDWIKTQPDLDADRVVVQGASYGGYLALSVATKYPDRIRGVVSESAISNLASFVERTEGWRRDLQRSEFGDERDPKTREFLERIAPLNNAQDIKKPLLIIQGQNDPRVPVAEASRLVDATKNRVPVWYILAKDEGHGFVQEQNRNYRTYATILFVKEFLLK